MRLPRPLNTGVPSVGRAPDQSFEIESGYRQIARGFSDVANTLASIEKDRLDEQAREARHSYLVDAINIDARELTKQFYEPDDPALEGLDIPTTEKRVLPNGDIEEVPRQSIPSDEVWPKLLTKAKTALIESKASRIESLSRRERFIQEAEQRVALDNLRLAEYTARHQYAREKEQRKFMANQFRELGAWDELDNLIKDIDDVEERRELKEWANTVKEVDGNTAVIANALDTRNADILAKEWEKYLEYTSGKRKYTGVLDKDQLEDQANRFYQAMNRVNLLNNADNKLFLGDVKYNAREVITNMNNGYFTDPMTLAQVRNDVATAQTLDADNETLYNLGRDLDKAQMTSTLFRELINEAPKGGTVRENLEDWEQRLNTESMDPTTRSIAHNVQGLINRFRSDMDRNPIGALQTYGLVDESEAPIFPVDWASEDLPQQIAAREEAYNYYQGIYEFQGDILNPAERTSLESLLENDMFSDDLLIAISTGVVQGSARYRNKFFGPSINDKIAGKYAAMGQLMVDFESMGNPQAGLKIARTVRRGFERWSSDPTILEDYVDARAKMREALGQTYNMFPGVMNTYMDLATAYSIASETDRFVKSKEAYETLNTVTGGLIENGGSDRYIMAPQPGLTQRQWNEWLDEYSPENIQRPLLGWTAEEVVRDLRRERLLLQPTGRARNQFYVVDPRNPTAPALRYQDGSPYIHVYDPNAEKRFTR